MNCVILDHERLLSVWNLFPAAWQVSNPLLKKKLWSWKMAGVLQTTFNSMKNLKSKIWIICLDKWAAVVS